MTTTPTLRDAARPIETPEQFALAALVAAGHVSQSKVDKAIALYPGAAPADALADPVARLHDDGYWTPEKNEAGRRLNDNLMRAGSPAVLVHTATQLQQAVARALEELKFHPQASHVEPNYRDWFNKTIDAAIRAKGQQ